MKRYWLIILIMAFILPLFAQNNIESDRNWYLNKTIVDIRFTGLETISENELRAVTKDFIGKDFTDSLSWEIQARLYALEYFEVILANVEGGDANKETVIIVFDVKEKPSIEEINFIGNDRIRKNELRDTVLATKGDILNNSSLRLDNDSLNALYLEKGFLNASVEYRSEIDSDTNTAKIYFEIKEGIQTKISEVHVTGNSNEITEKNILGLMKTKPQSLFNKGLFVESTLQEDIVNIQNFYNSRGYIDMKVANVQKDIILDEEDGINKMVITLILDEGEVFTFDQISFQGNTIFTDEELLESFVLLSKGSIMNMISFEKGFQKVNDLYYENGYIYNLIEYKMIRNENENSISFVINIVERDRAHIESITVRGNDRTKDYVILREIPMAVGDVFNRTKLIEGWQNLMNTQYFSSVEPQTYPGSTDLLMDLVIDVEEGKTANLLFGMTFAGGPDFPISGQIQWSDSNFMGSGRNIGVSSNFSIDTQSLSLKYNEPWLFGVRWSGGFDLTYSHRGKNIAEQDIDGNGIPDPYLTMDEYEQSSAIVSTDDKMIYSSHNVSVGFTTGYTWITPLGRATAQTGIREGFEYLEYDEDLYRPYSPSIMENHKNWRQNDSLFVKGILDKRDIGYDPNRGYLLSQQLTVAGFTPTSTKQYFKTASKLGLYATLFDIPINDDQNFKSVLSLDSAFSFIFEKPWLPDYILDLSDDGYYIDGMFIARGWNVQTGGKALWDNTISLKFPIVKQILSYDIFLDAVGIWNSDLSLKEMGLDDFRFSLGTGIRFANPSFPIGLYLVKKFTFDEDGKAVWDPESNYTEFKDWGLDLVVAFELDIY
jgi:outer membrane protein insertion porin family